MKSETKITTEQLTKIENIEVFLKCSRTQETFLVHLLKRFTDKKIKQIVENNFKAIEDILKANAFIVDTKVFELILNRLCKVDNSIDYSAKEKKVVIAVADTSRVTTDRFKAIEDTKNYYREVELKTDDEIKALMRKKNISEEEIAQHFKAVKQERLF